MSPDFDLYRFVLMFIPLLFAVTIHEAAHGYAAFRFGDSTARDAGRLTLNPIRHIDPLGSVIIPLVLLISGAPFLFGYARPVPVNFSRLHPIRRGMMVVAAAGVTANICCAIASGLIFQGVQATAPIWAGSAFSPAAGDLLQLLFYSAVINTVLFVFNLIPVPPLDGSRIVSTFLPPDLARQYARIEPFGMLIIIFLIVAGPVDKLFHFFIAPMINLFLGQ